MEWISVKERLPDKGADVLMWFESNMAVGFWHDTDKDHTFWCAFTDEGYYTDCDSEPTYWMPLPELPNERTDCEADVEEYAEMTIEAAIKHCEEVSRRSPCTPCEREHMRLAAWLTELVSLRAQQKQPNEPLTGPLKIGDSFHGMKIIGLDALAGTITFSGWEPFHRKPEQEG